MVFDEPVFQNPGELRLWKRINRKGLMGTLLSLRGGDEAILEEILSGDGGLHPAILTALMDRVRDMEGKPLKETLAKLAQRSRILDCMPSVHASRMMLDAGDTTSAAELLSLSSRSQEVRTRMLMAAEIYLAEGDNGNAFVSAQDVVGTDPSCDRAYRILMELDPEGDWGLRRDIYAVFEGREPTFDHDPGRLQDLYTIYYEWFRGNKDSATDSLVRSPYYIDGDPDFMLASARMSMDEGDWRSARMMYDKLLSDDAPSHLICEAVEAYAAGGDHNGALDLLVRADRSSPRVMDLYIRIQADKGDVSDMMDSIRVRLGSESSVLGNYLLVMDFLIDRGMYAEAGSVLEMMDQDSIHHPEVLVRSSILSMRAGNDRQALSSAKEAVRRDQNNLDARTQRARMLHRTGEVDYAWKECIAILSRDPNHMGALVLSRDISLSSARWSDAVSVCERILSNDPGDTVTRVAFARAKGSLGDVDDAMDTLVALTGVELDPREAEEVVGLMVDYGRYGDAIASCIKLEQKQPNSSKLRRLRGNAEYHRGEFLKASVAYSESLRINPADPWTWHSKGMADEARGDMDSAEASFERSVSLDPYNPRFWDSKGSAQESRGDQVGALQSFRRSYELDPTSVYPLIHMAGIFRDRGHGQDALRCVDQAISRSRSRDLDIMKMSILADMGRHTDAVSYGLSVLEEGPDTEVSIMVATFQMDVLNDPRSAVITLDRALVSDPDSDAINTLRAEAVVRSEGSLEDIVSSPGFDVSDAMGTDEQVPDQDTAAEAVPEEDPDSLFEMSVSLLSAGDVRGAMRMAERALSYDPGNPDYMCVKARAVLATGDREGATMIVIEGLTDHPDHADLHHLLGSLRVSAGDYGGALSELDSAINHGVDCSDVYSERGDVHERLGNLDRAIGDYEIAVAKDPGRVDLMEKLARMLLSSGNTVSAEAYISRVLAEDPYRVSAIVLRAELFESKGDPEGVLASLELFKECPNPGADNTVRMVKMLESMGHEEEARELMGNRHGSGPDEKTIRRYAERALRRAFATRTDPCDPDMLSALGMDHVMVRKVSDYIGTYPDYGRISPGSDEFEYMEVKSRDVIMKCRWTDLENESRIPLDKVFVTGGFSDVEDARMLVAYVFKVMHMDVGRRSDPKLTQMSMRLPKGMTVYEIMEECGVGVYEARVIAAQIV